MKCDRETMLLYAVTDRAWTGKMNLYEQVESALKNGVTCVQLREKELDNREFLEEAIKLKKICGKYKVPLIINDNVEVAVKSNADGVHVGQEDMRAEEVRRLVGGNMLIGVSAHTVAEAIEAVKNGADYLGLGSVFPTSTKPDADPMTYKRLKEICSSVEVPTVAIGGITKDNVKELADSGVDGIAVVSAIFGAADPGAAAAELLGLAKEMVASHG